ncbi:hypothetical protein H5410_037417 [Solanum commersonii]|uniref:Transmembrane protein n=1 Tax=Solanum commersonii TaxID=4109 RepID=A0A9J5Y733_SOLCO|nr:hypothetical protein H5410_037417 [Solanum commersonii]
MNAILESPVEDYWSFDIVWTWVAVVTAAVSFWKMKASSSTLPTPLVTVASSSKERTPASNNMMMLSDDAFSEGTKGKLTVYFKQDEDGDECINTSGDDDDDDDDQEGEEDHGVEWFENWEKLLKLRNGEMGWYCYQDMKVINGSIVRLWDEQRELSTKNCYCSLVVEKP